MKKKFFLNWVMFFCITFTYFFNVNKIEAGDTPKFRAKPVPRAKKVLFPNIRAFQKKMKEGRVNAPSIDDEAKNPTLVERTTRCVGNCHPKRPPLITTEVPPPVPLLVTEVPPPVPLLVTEVPPPVPLLVTEVPPTRPLTLLVAHVPETSKPELIQAFVPESENLQLIVANVPDGRVELIQPGPIPEAEVVVNYIQLPCPPVQECVEDVRRVQVVNREQVQPVYPVYQNVERGACRDNRQMYQPQPPVGVPYGNQFMNDIPCQNNWQTQRQEPRFHQGGNQFGGQRPIQNGGQSRGGNYDRAMAWGHYVVNNAYGIGYGIGTNAYDVGRNW